MLSKVKVEESGDTNLLPGALVDILELRRINEKAVENGLQPATIKRVLLGITKASLATRIILVSIIQGNY